MSKPDAIKRVAVSYAWGVEDKSPEAQSVAAFVKRLEARGIDVIYDKQDNTFGADRLFVFLSPAYLKSVNCMYELLTDWNVCKANPNSFRDRVFAWTMDGVGYFFPQPLRVWKTTAPAKRRTRRYKPNSERLNFTTHKIESPIYVVQVAPLSAGGGGCGHSLFPSPERARSGCSPDWSR